MKQLLQRVLCLFGKKQNDIVSPANNGQQVLDSEINPDIKYELWGHDTFASHTYLIKIYENKEEADQKAKTLKKKAQSQPKALRDSYWLNEATEKQIHERETCQQAWRSGIAAAWDFDEKCLYNDVVEVLGMLMKVIAQDEQGLIQDDITTVEVVNPREKDCYSKISFEYHKKSSNVGGIISYRDGSNMTCTGFFIPHFQDLHTITPSEELYDYTVNIFRNNIMENYFDALR